MPLLERVATLLRANLIDLIERAEDPLKMINQVILDMENQFLQVKTQVAVAVADQHLLQKKREESAVREADWMRKAEIALQRKDDDLARAALQRAVASRDLSKSFDEQLADQKVQVENLKSALHKLDAKLAEARMQAEVLRAQHRRARSANRAADAQAPGSNGMDKARERIASDAAMGQAKTETFTGNVEERFASIEKQEEIEHLLAELKRRRSS